MRVHTRLPTVGLAPQRPWPVLSFEPSRWRVMQEFVPTQLSCPAVELGRLHGLEAPHKNRRHKTGHRLDMLSYRAFICDVVAPHVAATFAGPCDEVVFHRASPSLRVMVPGARPSGRRHWARRQGVLGTWCVCNECDSEDGGSSGGRPCGLFPFSFNAARRQGSARLCLAGARHGKARAPPVAMVTTPARAAATAGATTSRAATAEEGVAEVAAVEGMAGLAGAQGSDAAGRAQGRSAGRTGRGKEAWRVARGELCVREGWLEAAQLAALREDVRRLEASGRFAPSGVATAGRLTSYELPSY